MKLMFRYEDWNYLELVFFVHIIDLYERFYRGCDWLAMLVDDVLQYVDDGSNDLLYL